MATPSSSATSPSPPMTYVPHSIAPSSSASPLSTNLLEKEQRQRAIQKFMARAEISTITRSLRTRLSYASYKATHNVHHIPLRDLEAQSQGQNQNQNASFSRSIPAKRRAAGYGNNYNNLATQGPPGVSTGSSSVRRGGSGTMLPPSTTSSPRSHYPAVNGGAYATTSINDQGSHSRTTNLNQTLYTSILTPSPAKQARTVHNAGNLPGSTSSRSPASPRARVNKSGSRTAAEVTRSQAKGKKPENTSSPKSPSTRKVKRPPNKGKQKQQSGDAEMDVDGDVDMKAAAALTSLLLHHRPSITGSVSSPRSSIDGSEAGSVYSHSHFAQSSARTIAAASPPGPLSATASTATINDSSFRNQTPPPLDADSETVTTPRPAPADSEAANLMLFLATSPSPARPANKDSAAYRTLGGGPQGALRDKGRVLFASGTITEPSESSRGQAISRDGDSSFASSISSIGIEPRAGSGSDGGINTLTTPLQLLPPPSLPSHKHVTESPPDHGSRMDVDDNTRPAYSQGPMEFNFSDFIHGSPSPSRGPMVPVHKANLGLRADVGRKLFEEEQMRHALSSAQGPGKPREDRALGAGFDLVQS